MAGFAETSGTRRRVECPRCSLCSGGSGSHLAEVRRRRCRLFLAVAVGAPLIFGGLTSVARSSVGAVSDLRVVSAPAAAGPARWRAGLCGCSGPARRSQRRCSTRGVRCYNPGARGPARHARPDPRDAIAIAVSGSADLQAERVPFHTYSASDGLAHDRIRCVLADSRGFLWFCTPDGLSRFDGSRFVNYGPEHGLPHPAVEEIVEAGPGVYWVATPGWTGPAAV